MASKNSNVKPLLPKKSAKSIKKTNKRLWGNLKLVVTATTKENEPVAPTPKENPYVDIKDFNDEEFELDCDQPTYDGRTYYQAAFLLAHASSGQHLDHTFDQGARRIYNVVHAVWYEYYIYCFFGIAHCILGLYSSSALASIRTLQITLECSALMIYLVDIYLIRRLALQENETTLIPKTRHATLHEGTTQIVFLIIVGMVLLYWFIFSFYCLLCNIYSFFKTNTRNSCILTAF